MWKHDSTAYVQGPSNLLPAPEPEMIIQDVTHAPAEVSAHAMYAWHQLVQAFKLNHMRHSFHPVCPL